MQLFNCPQCGQRVYFNNTFCPCGTPLTYAPQAATFVPDGPFCARREDIGCNWIAEGDGGLCRSCAMTSTIPDLSLPENLTLLGNSAAAKRWVLANLARWGWFSDADPGPRPVFRMLSERTGQDSVQITMGHADGVITINVVESDPAQLVQRQQQLGELYRSMRGHMRHEIAHFLFARLAALPDFLPAFRALFGDERADYEQALQQHYSSPTPPGDQFITEYATMHPHEDWAETAAHVMHLVDMTDSFMAAGLSGTGIPAQGYDAYADTDAERLMDTATAVALAVNEVNRALDIPDVYPFVLSAQTRAKLAFAHRWLSQGALMAPAA